MNKILLLLIAIININIYLIFNQYSLIYMVAIDGIFILFCILYNFYIKLQILYNLL